MGHQAQGQQPEVRLDESLAGLSPELIAEYVREQEREHYLSVEGFLDFVRDSGAAPDAQDNPHGLGAHSILNWTSYEDPEAHSGIGYLFKMQLWPRGSFKSAVFNVGHVCWEIAKNPNIRICVCSSTGKQARKFVRQAMQIIDSPWFRERFGAHKGKDWKEGSGSFTSALRTDKHKKEATLQAAGTGEVWTGSHWDLVIMDDVIDQENTRTPEAIETTRYWFGEILAQLDPGCRLLLIGTLHHYADMYCSIMKDPEMRSMFEISQHSWQNPDGSLFFPGQLTTKFIETQKKLLPPRLFACFYENKPTTNEEQVFRPEYFRTIPDQDIPHHVWTYILTDFAFIAEEKKKKKADRTVFWVVSLDCNRTAYVRDIIIGRWKPSDSLTVMCDLWNRYQHHNLKACTIEDTAHKEVLMGLLEEIRRRTFIRPRMVTIPGRNQETKDMRIEGIEPRFRSGNIWFAQSLRDQHFRKWKPMIDEMTEWPFSAHDDIPDAISDLDKKDAKGESFLCPAPPAGWRHAMPVRVQPTTVNGRYNPEHGYPAREMIRAEQMTNGDDLWRERGHRAVGADLFRPR